MKKVLKEYNWSDYQLNIFDFVNNGQGNAVVEASAGSGKSTTLMHCLSFIDEEKKVLLTAFNNDIVKELAKKSKKRDNTDVKTLHSLGLMVLKTNYCKEELKLDNYKYHNYINTNLSKLSSINLRKLKRLEYGRYKDNIINFVNYGRYYLCQTIEDLALVEDRYEISTIEDEKAVALQALEWGKHYLDTIDYTDMIWLPHVLHCSPYCNRYDWIFCDECQDMNKAERELMLLCRKKNTRFIAFGDSAQMLYSFAGGDPESFKSLKEIPNTVSFPLSISYRCADSIVDFAKRLVPSIEKNTDGRQGTVKYGCKTDEISNGDMVLCRNNAPLMGLYNTFISEGKECYVRGKDIGNNLNLLIKKTGKDELNLTIKKDGVFVRLYDSLFTLRDQLMFKNNIDKKTAMSSVGFINRLDSIHALETLAEGLTTAEELIDKVSNVFKDKSDENSISLSTIHKAKGLEANRVFILGRKLMPAKSAKKEWEVKQEQNLMYVAYTRPKNFLGFFNEELDDKLVDGSATSMQSLDAIENIVNNLLGKDSTFISADTSYADMVIEQAKKVEKVKSNTKTLSSSNTDIFNETGFNNAFKNKFAKKARRRKSI